MATSEAGVPELTDETFEAEAKQEGWCLVDFYAIWCPHCRAFRPVLEEVAAGFGGPVKFFAANVEACREAAEQYGVMSIPTLVLLRDGQQVELHVGGMGAGQLADWLKGKTEA
jgi:thioredoxin